jgi:hypothetical protein
VQEATSRHLVIEYQVTESDFVSAALSACRISGLSKAISYYLLPVLGWASIVLGSVNIILTIREGEDWKPHLVILGIGALWLLWHYLRTWRLGRAYRKDPRFKSPITVAINGSEWDIKTATGEAHYRHGTFIKAIETNAFFFFYYSPVMFNFLPKRFLTSDQQVVVYDFLNRELPMRKGKRWLPAPVQ